MPYKVSKDTNACPVSKPWCVKKQADGKVMGCHESKDKANAQMAALMASEMKKEISLPVQYRHFELDRAALDSESRTMELTFSSDYPVQRRGFFGNWIEILDHEQKSVVMDRLNNGAAVLFNHHSDDLIGVVESASIDSKAKKGRATIRLGSNAQATERYQDVMDGILHHVSVGYIDHEVVLEKQDKEANVDTYRVTRWEPIEISLVANPADPTVGIGREQPMYQVRVLDLGGKEISAIQNSAAADMERTAMENENGNGTGTSAVAAGGDGAGANGNDNGSGNGVAARAEVTRENYSQTAADIQEVGTKYNVPPGIVHEMLAKGYTLGEAKERCAEYYLRNKTAQTGIQSGFAETTVMGMTGAERRNYSLRNVICDLAGEQNVHAGLEREVSNSIAKQLKRTTQGMFVPTCLNPPQTRSGLDTKSGSAGGFTVATDVRDLIELLRSRNKLIQLGAQVLGGLTDTVAFPVQLTGSSLTWVSENPGSDVSESDATFGQRVMSPKECAATTAFSRKLLAQSSIDIEATVRNDIAMAHSTGIDVAGINGSGLSNQPLGILGTTGVGSVAYGTDGGVPAYSHIINLETAVAKANADVAAMAYLSTPSIRGLLKQTVQVSTVGTLMIWQQDGNAPGVGTMNGYPAHVSNNVPSTLTKGSGAGVGVCHAILFGDWSQVYIGEWGVLEILVDPYRLKKQAMIEVTSHQMVDVLVRQPAAMAAMQDARLS